MTGKELLKLAKKYHVRCSSGCGRIATRVITERYYNDHLVTFMCGKCGKSKYGDSPITFEQAIEYSKGDIGFGVTPQVFEANMEWWAQFQNSPAKDDLHYRIDYDDILEVLEK